MMLVLFFGRVAGANSASPRRVVESLAHPIAADYCDFDYGAVGVRSCHVRHEVATSRRSSR